jgi:mucin-19
MTFDAAGNLLVVDFNQAIRKITPEAVVSKLVQLYSVDGLDASGCKSPATFISDIASDVAGTVYFADSRQHIVCRVTAQGEFSLLAGSTGQPGSDDGEGVAARFLHPSHLAFDAAGTLYVSDAGNHTLRKISPQGVVSTLAGSAGQAGASDGVGAQARFSSPGDLVIARDGSLYIADPGNAGIRKMAPDGTVRTFIHASGSDLPSGIQTAPFGRPTAMALGPGGQLYIADDAENVVLRAILP